MLVHLLVKLTTGSFFKLPINSLRTNYTTCIACQINYTSHCKNCFTSHIGYRSLCNLSYPSGELKVHISTTCFTCQSNNSSILQLILPVTFTCQSNNSSILQLILPVTFTCQSNNSSILQLILPVTFTCQSNCRSILQLILLPVRLTRYILSNVLFDKSGLFS